MRLENLSNDCLTPWRTEQSWSNAAHCTTEGSLDRWIAERDRAVHSGFVQPTVIKDVRVFGGETVDNRRSVLADDIRILNDGKWAANSQFDTGD